MAHRRRRYVSEYEYGYQGDPDYRQRRHRNPALRLLDRILFLFVIPLPLAVLGLWLLELPIPLLALGFYVAVTQTAAGLLFIVLTACNVGGFGKVGYFFTHTRGKRWMTTKEAKQNTYLFGFLMLVLGILLLLWTIKLI